jgi:polyphenol oxidase
MKKINVIFPKIFSGISKIRSGISTKISEESDDEFGMNLSFNVGDDPERVQRNRKIFFTQAGILENDLAIPLQCHSNIVRKVNKPGEYKECDALITNVSRVALAVTVADCVPILFFDPVKKVIGAVHAGWKGTVNSIAKRAVEKMIVEYKTDPAQMLVYIGPSAGVCCYEIGKEVAIKFGNKVVPYEKKTFLDLKQENMAQLLQVGVIASNVEVSKFCTICENRLFHSFRRDGKKSGRMLAIICMIQ